MELEIKNLLRKLAYKLDKYEVEVGILENSKRRKPIFGKFKSYAGKKLLREGKVSDVSMVEVAEQLDKKFKWLRNPFLSVNNKEIVAVLNDIVKDMNGKGQPQRILNGFQAVVRNPILRGDYGRNSTRWAREKGFSQLLMLTGQFFRNIKARFKK